MSLPTFTGFRPAALTFFRGLTRNNKKDWFEAKREVYEEEVKRPLALLVEEIDARLGTLAPELTGNPKRSAFRIYRDVRFSKDKTPYKTHAACWFYHRDVGKTSSQTPHGGAGLYFHLQPGASFLGGGFVLPDSPLLKQIREHIVENQAGFEKIVRAPAFKRAFGSLSTDVASPLTRNPRGYAPDHPASEWLRYKSFIASAPLTDEQVLNKKLPDLLMKRYVTMLPFIRWLNQSVGLRPHSRR